MLSHCWKCRKNTESTNPKLAETKNGKKNAFIKMCHSKKSKFIKEQEASGLLSSLGIKASLSKIPLVDPPFLEVLTS